MLLIYIEVLILTVLYLKVSFAFGNLLIEPRPRKIIDIFALQISHEVDHLSVVAEPILVQHACQLVHGKALSHKPIVQACTYHPLDSVH